MAHRLNIVALYQRNETEFKETYGCSSPNEAFKTDGIDQLLVISPKDENGGSALDKKYAACFKDFQADRLQLLARRFNKAADGAEGTLSASPSTLARASLPAFPHIDGKPIEANVIDITKILAIVLKTPERINEYA